jgi:hypothetical protein
LLRLDERFILIGIAISIESPDLIVKIFVEIVKERTDCVCWPIESPTPKALLAAGVSNHVIAVSRKIDCSVNVT